MTNDEKKLSVSASILIGSGVVAASVLGAGFIQPTGGTVETVIEQVSVEDWVRSNPQIILDTINEHIRKQQAERQAQEPASREAPAEIINEIINDKSNHVLGNPKGSYVIIEFFDYQCGWCKKTNKAMSEAVKKAKNIRWILMDNPIFGPASEKIALYGLAAAKQGKYKEFHKAVGEAEGQLDEAALINIGKAIGANTKKLTAYANSEAAKNKLASNRKYSRKLKINGVPMMIVNGKIHPGALLGDKLEEAVAASNAK